MSHKVFTKTIRLPNGKILIATDYGIEAFCFEVTEEQHQKYLESKKET